MVFTFTNLIYPFSLLPPLNLRTNLHTPIRMQTLSRNKAAIHAHQKYKTSRPLTRLSESTHRTSKLFLRLLFHCRWNQPRPDPFRTYCVYANTLRELLVGDGAGEGYDGAL